MVSSLVVSAEASCVAIARLVRVGGVGARRRCVDFALRLKSRLIVERADRRRDFHRRIGGRCCFLQDCLASSLPQCLKLCWICQPEPHGQYVFGRSVPPALCGTFPGLEYVSTIDG